MSPAQREAHERLQSLLAVRTVADDDWHDDPKNWKQSNRPLTPSELAYAWKALDAA